MPINFDNFHLYPHHFADYENIVHFYKIKIYLECSQ